MEKEQIVSQALQRLNLFADTQLSSNESPVYSSSKVERDSEDVLKLQSANFDQSYSVFVQSWAPQKDINALVSEIKATPDKAILFADFVNPVMAEKLRQRSISFVDCAGNLSIKNPQQNWYVKGKKSPQVRNKRVRGRAFNAAGLKLIFAIFNQPSLLHASYRDIAKKVGIALGSVGPVIDDLYASGYILDDGERRLVNKKRLYERWVDGYLEKLRPKQLMACYSSEDKDWWKEADAARFSGLWGGEVIIARPTPFMVPETISLYFSSQQKQKDFAEFYNLRLDDEGDICIYKGFWAQDGAAPDDLNPMITYADIVDSINPGSWDVAKTFYGEAVGHLLQD